jgi:geranylgeranyl pyrophosphate synthase
MSRRLRLVDPPESRRVRRAFSTFLRPDAAIEPHLRAVIEDVLAHPGSLARAQLAFGLGRRLGIPTGRALRLAVATESFHASSLIFDDLPAMDDAAERRGRPCPHRIWGEAAATLGALAFITRGYALLWEGIGPLPPRRRDRAAALVGECLGLTGILDGQSRDVHFTHRPGGEAEMLRVEAAKTVPLIRLALLLPALAAGLEERTLARLERLAAGWGLAYQVLDDFKDDLLTGDEAGKTTGRDRSLGRPNLPARAGHLQAFDRLGALLAGTAAEVAALSRRSAERWEPLARLQGVLDESRQRVAERLAWPRTA